MAIKITGTRKYSLAPKAVKFAKAEFNQTTVKAYKVSKNPEQKASFFNSINRQIDKAQAAKNSAKSGKTLANVEKKLATLNQAKDIAGR
jgi:hypothetical protein